MQPAIRILQQYLFEYRPHVMALGVSLVLGVVIGIVRANTTSSAAEQAERWRLPNATNAPATGPSAEDINTLFWAETPRELKKKADPNAAKKKIEAWRFVGTVDQGPDVVAVIEIGGTKISRLKVGATLPDEAVITKIDEGELTLDRQGTPQTVRLFLENKPQ